MNAPDISKATAQANINIVTMCLHLLLKKIVRERSPFLTQTIMPNSKCKVIFFGTPQVAVPVLEALTKADFCDVVAVVTQPDKAVGRHHSKVVPSRVKITAQNHKIEVLEGLSTLALSDNHPLPLLEKEGILSSGPGIKSADLGVVVAYGEILPKWILDHFPLGIVNIHPSLLPKYRGPSPVQAAILNRDEITGVSIIKLDEETDHGPIIAQEAVSLRVRPGRTKQSYGRLRQDASENHLNRDDKIASPAARERRGRNDGVTAGELGDYLFNLGAELLVKTLPDYIAGWLTLRPQDEAQASYTKKLTKESGKIDWTKSPEQIEAHIRAMNPWPGAWMMWKGKRLIIWSMSEPGQIEELQLEGSRRMLIDEFLRGHPNFKISNCSNF